MFRENAVNRAIARAHEGSKSEERRYKGIGRIYVRVQRDREVGADVTKRPEPLINDAEQSAQLITAALSRGLAKNTN